jgi:diaminohydroxyphosphoribosylaminopyrimidine deaminase/5-amino-6-(5-phosphoribosylamino)uracil reductase
MTDPYPLVDGRGIKYLRDHGIDVESGVLEKECEEINRPFIKYIKTKRPYVVMKAGVSLDGRLNYQSGISGWITGDKAARTVHQLRNQLDAIMVGSSTILIDNPSLTTRLPGKNGKDPVQIVLDTNLATPIDSKVYQHISDTAPMVFCSNTVSQEKRNTFEKFGVRVFTVKKNNDGLDLKEVLSLLGQEGILSVLVEGGGVLHGSFLREQLYDYAYLFYGPRFAGDSGQALVRGFNVTSRDRAPSISSPQYKTLGEDMLVSGRLLYPDKE